MGREIMRLCQNPRETMGLKIPAGERHQEVEQTQGPELTDTICLLSIFKTV